MMGELSDEQVLQATSGVRRRAGERTAWSAVCTDSRQVTPGCLFVALVGDRYDGHDFAQAALDAGAGGVLVQKGHPLTLREGPWAHFEVEDTLRALGRLAACVRRRFEAPLGAVTGSNGKTTTKELVASILSTRGPALKTQGNLNNEVGLPLTLFGLDAGQVAAVVELGMNHPGEIARLTDIARPDAGLITTVQPAHLEGCGSLEGVARAKGELFLGLGRGATAVVNADEPLVVAQTVGLRAKRLTFGQGAGVDVRLLQAAPRGRAGQTLVIGFAGRRYPVALRLLGQHNALNATGAFAMGVALGYRPDECVQGLDAAVAHPRRMQLLDAPGGVTVVDDCYNANPASMLAALKTLPSLAGGGRAVAVLGDMLELGTGEPEGHLEVGQAVVGAASLVAFVGPRMAAAHAEAAKTLGDAAAHFDEVPQLLAWLSPKLRSGDVVLVKASRGMRLERVVDALVGGAEAR